MKLLSGCRYLATSPHLQIISCGAQNVSSCWLVALVFLFLQASFSWILQRLQSAKPMADYHNPGIVNI